MAVLLPLLLALGAAPAAALAGGLRPRLAAPVGVVFAALSFAAVLWGWASGGGAIDGEWAPSLGLRFSFTLDGLAALYSLLATGIGLAVVVYSSGYLPSHLEHEGLPDEDQVRFYAFVLMFMGSMVGLVMAQDLLLIFLFWDMTAIASYFLIGYDRHKAGSRSAALMALLVTGVTAVLFLTGSIILYVLYGTFSLPELIARAEPGSGLALAGGLMAVAALAKSAQFPFHFWLPRAMAAPTPVSAYLHSAAMVAAGVFLLGRIYPILSKSDLLLDLLLLVGLASMALGGVMALSRKVLKQLLAYSTIAQYGYVVAMLGLGGAEGVLGASFYVLAHALAKSALFLTAGAVTIATGEDRFSALGGLARRMPLLAISSAVAAAALAGLPLTIGFFKDELFFASALHRGTPFGAMALMGAALTLAYSWRFWSGVFLGHLRAEPHPISARLTGPVLALGALSVAGGLATGPFAGLAAAAASVSLSGLDVPVSLAYHLDTRPENLMALATYTLGASVILSRPLWAGAADGAASLGALIGPERWYRSSLAILDRLSSWLDDREVQDLRERVAAILLPTGVLLAIALAVTPMQGAFIVGDFEVEETALMLAVLIAAGAALATALARSHLALVLLLSGVGYSLAVVYAFMGAPDVALVAVLVETVFSLLLLGMLTLFPEEIPRADDRTAVSPWRRLRDPFLGLVSAAGAMVVAWGALSQPSEPEVAVAHLELTPQTHASDVVTAILADLRGLDTMGEITVIAIGLVGVVALVRGGNLRWPPS